MFFQNLKKVVFIGAHTDDEMVAAGTLRKLVKSGVKVELLSFSYAPIPNKTSGEAAKILGPEFDLSMEAIGIPETDFGVLNFEPRTMTEKQSEIRQIVFNYVEQEKPDLAFILSSEDDHQDHSVLGKICQIVMKNRVPNILRCHYPWNFVLGPSNLFVPLLPDELETKMDVIRAYKSQHFRYDYESTFSNLTRLNGEITKNLPSESFEIVHMTAGR